MDNNMPTQHQWKTSGSKLKYSEYIDEYIKQSAVDANVALRSEQLKTHSQTNITIDPYTALVSEINTLNQKINMCSSLEEYQVLYIKEQLDYSFSLIVDKTKPKTVSINNKIYNTLKSISDANNVSVDFLIERTLSSILEEKKNETLWNV